MDFRMPNSPVLHYLPEFPQIHVHWVGDANQPFYLLMSLSPLPSTFPNIRVFFNESALYIRWLKPKYWSFRLSISLFNEYSGFIFFRINWLDPLTVQFSSVTQSCETLCDPMDCSKQVFPVHHQLPELAQPHVHHVGAAIQPSIPLSFPSLPAFNPFPASGSFPMSQFFASGGQNIGVSAQHQSFQWIFRTDYL